VDEGARTAVVEKGKSLLPAGVKKVAGSFKEGAMVDVRLEESGKVIARGLCNYSSAEIEKIMGCKTAEIGERLCLEQKAFDEVIHRDNMVVIE
jgi:glutamate 5-kinase